MINHYEESLGAFHFGGRVMIIETKAALAWIEIHQEDLMANWQLAVTGNKIFSIDPLK